MAITGPAALPIIVVKPPSKPNSGLWVMGAGTRPTELPIELGQVPVPMTHAVTYGNDNIKVINFSRTILVLSILSFGSKMH